MTALVVYLQNTLARLRERQEGQTMAEYALILGGIAVVVIAGILILGPAIRNLFQYTGSSVSRSRARRSQSITIGLAGSSLVRKDARRPRFRSDRSSRDGRVLEALEPSAARRGRHDAGRRRARSERRQPRPGSGLQEGEIGCPSPEGVRQDKPICRMSSAFGRTSSRD